MADRQAQATELWLGVRKQRKHGVERDLQTAGHCSSAVRPKADMMGFSALTSVEGEHAGEGLVPKQSTQLGPLSSVVLVATVRRDPVASQTPTDGPPTDHPVISGILVQRYVSARVASQLRFLLVSRRLSVELDSMGAWRPCQTLRGPSAQPSGHSR